MAGIDTNVVIRILVQDDPTQTAAALALVERTRQAGKALFVPVTVILESEWVLRSRYRFPKDQVLEALSQFYSVASLEFESEQAVGVALQLYATRSADFADCLHIALTWQAQQQPFWTFDQAAAAVEGAALLKTA